MKSLIILIIAVVLLVTVLGLYACFKVAGDLSREEEKRDGH